MGESRRGGSGRKGSGENYLAQWKQFKNERKKELDYFQNGAERNILELNAKNLLHYKEPNPSHHPPNVSVLRELLQRIQDGNEGLIFYRETCHTPLVPIKPILTVTGRVHSGWLENRRQGLLVSVGFPQICSPNTNMTKLKEKNENQGTFHKTSDQSSWI